MTCTVYRSGSEGAEQPPSESLVYFAALLGVPTVRGEANDMADAIAMRTNWYRCLEPGAILIIREH